MPGSLYLNFIRDSWCAGRYPADTDTDDVIQYIVIHAGALSGGLTPAPPVSP